MRAHTEQPEESECHHFLSTKTLCNDMRADLLDLLCMAQQDAALLTQSCHAVQETGFFPRADTDWEAFHEVQKLVLKNAGRT